MWLSQQGNQQQKQESNIQCGQVSVSGAGLAVFLQGERRNIALFSPGGYHWKPSAGEEVLVLHCDDEQSPCLIAKAQDNIQLSAGQIFISANGRTGITLSPNGDIHLTGDAFLNGFPIAVMRPTPT